MTKSSRMEQFLKLGFVLESARQLYRGSGCEASDGGFRVLHELPTGKGSDGPEISLRQRCGGVEALEAAQLEPCGKLPCLLGC